MGMEVETGMEVMETGMELRLWVEVGMEVETEMEVETGMEVMETSWAGFLSITGSRKA